MAMTPLVATKLGAVTQMLLGDHLELEALAGRAAGARGRLHYGGPGARGAALEGGAVDAVPGALGGAGGADSVGTHVRAGAGVVAGSGAGGNRGGSADGDGGAAGGGLGDALESGLDGSLCGSRGGDSGSGDGGGGGAHDSGGAGARRRGGVDDVGGGGEEDATLAGTNGGSGDEDTAQVAAGSSRSLSRSAGGDGSSGDRAGAGSSTAARARTGAGVASGSSRGTAAALRGLEGSTRSLNHIRAGLGVLDVEVLVGLAAVSDVGNEDLGAGREGGTGNVTLVVTSDGDGGAVHVHLAVADAVVPGPGEDGLAGLRVGGDSEVVLASKRAVTDVGLDDGEAGTLVVAERELARTAAVGGSAGSGHVVGLAGDKGSSALAGSSAKVDMVALAREIGAGILEGSGHGVVDATRVGVGVVLGPEGGREGHFDVGGGDLGTCKQGSHEAGGEGVVHHFECCCLVVFSSRECS